MAEFVDRQRKSRERTRPAVNFTRRDDVREFAGSGIGRNYNRMMDLQSQKNPNLDQLKQARRQWNRYDKYNAGEMLGKTPQQMQNEYMGISRDLRQSNKPAYNKMYPITGGIMDIGEKGGILGTILSQIGKMGKDKGIPTVVDDSVEDQEKYITDTFGPHLKDIEELDFTEEYAGPWPHEDMPIFPDIYRGRTPHKGLPPLDVYEGRRPHEDMPLLPVEAGQPPAGAVDVTGDPTRGRDIVDDIIETDLMPGKKPERSRFPKTYQKKLEAWKRLQEPQVIPGYRTSYVDDFADVVEEEEVPAAIPPYQGREFGLGQFMDTMPRDWQDYLEDMQRVGDVEGGYHKNKMTYEEWHDIMRRRR